IHNVVCTSKILCFASIIINGKNEFVCAKVIVVQKQPLVVRFEAVSSVDHFFGIGNSVSVSWSSGVHFGVQIHPCKQSPCGCTVCPAIFICPWSRQNCFKFFQFRFDVIKQ